MQKITVTYMTPRDLREVCEIERSVFPDPWSYNMFEEELSLPEMYTLVTVRLEGKVVGYGGLLAVESEGHITNLAVSPDHHSKRIGRIILGELIKLANLKSVRNLSLEVRTDNIIAQKLYREFDFSSIGLRRHYYGYGENALIMSAEDIGDKDYLKRMRDHLEATPYKVQSYVEQGRPRTYY